MEVGGEGDYNIPIVTLSPPDDSCIKMDSDESHFNVSLTVRDKVTRQCRQTATFEEKGEPKRSRTEVPLLTSLNVLPRGQTSQRAIKCQVLFIIVLATNGQVPATVV